ncbi:MAG: hypothetical protein L0154_08120 [Chloroflexi bacterium]|nr:hypothetical protein [Chloroflexota bacterium]
MGRSPGPLPYPSRLMLNVGIIIGGAIGFFIQNQRGSDAIEAFLITGGCAMVGALILSLIDIYVLQKR